MYNHTLTPILSLKSGSVYVCVCINRLVSNQRGVNLISLNITETRDSTKAFMAWKRILLLTWRHYNLHYIEDILQPFRITCFQWILWFCYQLIIEGRERVLFNQQEPPYLPTSGLNKDTLRKKFPETTWQNTSPIMRMDDQQKLSTYSIGQEIKWKWFHTIQGITLM